MGARRPGAPAARPGGRGMSTEHRKPVLRRILDGHFRCDLCGALACGIFWPWALELEFLTEEVLREHGRLDPGYLNLLTLHESGECVNRPGWKQGERYAAGALEYIRNEARKTRGE